MMIVAVNMALNASSLLFLIFIIIVYFSKKNMNNIDNMLYRLLLVCNFFNSAIHLLFLLVQWFEIENMFLLKLIVRGYWIPVQFYLVILICYMLYILKSEDVNFVERLNNQKKKMYTILGSILFVVFLLFAFLPFNIDVSGSLVNGFSGICEDLFYVLFVGLFLVNIVIVILYRKKENKKKILPFKVLLVFIIVGYVLVAINPVLCVTEFLVTIISYLMFHTIENPDLKLVNQLTLAKTEAEKANNAKSEFLSSMSHELRTPLNAIVGLSQMIESETDIEEMHKDSRDILKASNNLLELVDRILDINKLDSNDVEVINNNYNPKKLFEDIYNNMKNRIGDKPIDFRFRMSPYLPKILYGDEDKVKKIINNLISNAIKYTDEGSIDFNIDCGNIKDRCNLRITISDTGRGIKDDQKEFLFTKFYRLEEDRDSDIEGAGLGLAITKSLVELLDGEISVNSTEEMGTTFIVTLNQKVVNEEQNKEEMEIL